MTDSQTSAARELCAICHRPVWDAARPLELADWVQIVNLPVHRGCARRLTRLERELEQTAREGRACQSSRSGPGA